MKQDIFLQGNLYLRKKPLKYDYEEVEKIRNKTYEMYGEESSVKVGDDNYSGCSNIYRLIIDDEQQMNFILDNKFANEKIIPVTPEEIQNDYIPLIDFLYKAKYIGRKGV